MEGTTVYLFEKFIEIEDKYDLFSIEINHVKIWQYIRFTYCAQLLEELTGIKTTNRATCKTNCRLDKKQKGDWLKEKQFLLRRKDLLVVNHPRRVKDGKIYKCFVTDALLSQLDCSYYVFEDEYKGSHFKPVCTKGIKYRNVDVLQCYFSYKAEGIKREVKSVADKITNIFQTEFSEKFSNRMKSNTYNLISDALLKVFYGRLHAKIILAMIKPKAVIVTVYYNLYNQTLIEVAKSLGIPTIELQHGRIGDSHAAYNFAKMRNIESFPDYIFVYGRYEKEVPRYPIEREHIYATGYPELEKKAKYYREKKNLRKKKVITFISSPVEGEVVSKYAIELASKMKEKNIKIIYKLHPSEYNDWKKYYPDLESYGIKVIEQNEHDIYYYLGHSDYVVGISSTVLFEAMQFDTRIIIIKALDYRKCETIYENGYADLVSDVQEIIEMIKEKNIPDRKENSNLYFEGDSIPKMKRALQSIMNK